ncbi:MAG: succinylglutamate desuccinylase/aspartoacylase family protein [Cyclobacteriaceae bacterium]|nr:succinylglutamate desuccinylase/aspartoacylase family protein [Cyclobacteriaceae bacterium]
MNKPLVIAGITIQPGETKLINAKIARLPTRTTIDIPVIVSLAKKEGKGLLISGGLHGDEINGVEIVRRMIVNNYHKPKRGLVICIPLINIYGFLHYNREVPNGKDINRSFPGARKGSLASRIAYHITNDILPYIDYGVDLHTGGSRINNYPQIRAALNDPINVELCNAFAPPYIINSPVRDKSMRKQATKMNKKILVYEAGESMRLRKNAIDEGVNGLLRIMKHLGMRDDAPPQKKEIVNILSSSWVRARVSGIYHAYVRNGEHIKRRQVIGLITDPFGDFEKKVMAPSDGYVIAINNNPVVNKGDALLHLGQNSLGDDSEME